MSSEQTALQQVVEDRETAGNFAADLRDLHEADADNPRGRYQLNIEADYEDLLVIADELEEYANGDP